MPRPGPRKINTAIRLTLEELRGVDRAAEAEGLTRSEMIRKMIAEGLVTRVIAVK